MSGVRRREKLVFSSFCSVLRKRRGLDGSFCDTTMCLLRVMKIGFLLYDFKKNICMDFAFEEIGF